MIPVRLKLHNFMCYRDEVLDFSGIHLACICGDNGSGKSSLIDAMTWALWGRTRRRSKGTSDDDLIYASPLATEMMVEFDFLAGGQLYRGIRRHTRAKKSTSAGQ
ncbi:MAG: AAA family ATPase, partial [Dehalococcoidales bacterium]|nr:AAA family ATPase [Dehalococcoidales bacterium]